MRTKLLTNYYDPVFGADVVLAIGNMEEIKKKLKGYILTEYENLAGGVYLLDYEEKGKKFRKYLIFIENKNDFYVLLHECLHLARHILVDRDIKFEGDNDEVFAYYQNYWFKKLWRACARRNDKKTKS